jgi:hypothetical protein
VGYLAKPGASDSARGNLRLVGLHLRVGVPDRRAFIARILQLDQAERQPVDENHDVPPTIILPDPPQIIVVRDGGAAGSGHCPPCGMRSPVRVPIFRLWSRRVFTLPIRRSSLLLLVPTAESDGKPAAEKSGPSLTSHE